MRELKECGISGPRKKHWNKKGNVNPSSTTTMSGMSTAKKAYQHDSEPNVDMVCLGLTFTEHELHAGNAPSSGPLSKRSLHTGKGRKTQGTAQGRVRCTCSRAEGLPTYGLGNTPQQGNQNGLQTWRTIEQTDITRKAFHTDLQN